LNQVGQIGHIAWKAVLSSAAALAPWGCAASSSTAASSDDPPALSGEYRSDTGDRQSITFRDATSYSVVWRSCAAGAGLCAEEGTYALNEQRDRLTFKNAATGASTAISFAVDNVGPPPGAQTLAQESVTPLVEPGLPPDNPPSLTNRDAGSLLNVNSKIVVQFTSGKDVFKIKQPSTLLGVRG
jgi:hypothetical protein